MYSSLGRLEKGHVFQFSSTGTWGIVISDHHYNSWLDLDLFMCHPINSINNQLPVRDYGLLSDFINLNELFTKFRSIQ